MWQPIETCPKDGNPFLGLSGWSVATYRIAENPEEIEEKWVGVWPFRKKIETIKPSYLYFEQISDGGGITNVFMGRWVVQVTHWMPLPAPPGDANA